MKLSIAWCAGFAPLRNPEVAIAVMIEGVVPQDNIGGGKSAAPIAGKVLSKYFEKKNARHTSTEERNRRNATASMSVHPSLKSALSTLWELTELDLSVPPNLSVFFSLF